MSPSLQVYLLSTLAVALMALAFWIVWRVRRRKGNREQRRRRWVNIRGRLGDATITDVAEHSIFYEYTISGVDYTASQDISDLHEYIHGDLERLIGTPASLKYSGNNPANSIIVCEEWSGLRPVPATQVEPLHEQSTGN